MLRRLASVGLFVSLSLFAQRDLGTVTGTVTDQQGAVIAGAKVTIVEDATNLRFTTETDTTGVYVRPALKPGIYSIEVEASGFRKAVQRNVAVTGGDRIQANISLQLGDITQSIEISTAPPALQTESNIIGATLEDKETKELPLGGQRRFSFLARLSPAVVPPEPGARDAAGGGFSANGVRSNGQNNFLLNGVDNNVNNLDFINQTSFVVGPSVEAIGEMKVMTNGYNAEYGRSAGGVVNVTLKSGTNQIHGALFHFLQNDKLNSNLWENNRAGARRGPFKQNMFGGAIGGPIRKDKTFIFGNFQGIRIRSTGGVVPGLGNTFTRTIAPQAFRDGNFSSFLSGRTLGNDALGRPVGEGQIFDMATQRQLPNGTYVRDAFPGNIIPPSRFDPAARRLLSLFPQPNQNLTSRIPDNNYLVVTSGAQTDNQGDMRLDHRLSDKDTLFGSLSWSEQDKLNTPPFPGALDGAGFAGAVETNKGRNAQISYTRVWSPSIISETRLGFTRLVTARTQANADQDFFREFNIGGRNPFAVVGLNGGLPTLNPDGYSGFGGSEWLPTQQISNVWNLIQNVAINKGGHAFKFGFEGRDVRFPNFQVPSARGTFQFNRNRTENPQFPGVTGDGVASMLLGLAGGGTRVTTANGVSSLRKVYAGYFQDDWKVSQKLTFNLGVRYELVSPIGERFGRQSSLDYMGSGRPILVIPRGNNQDAPLPPNFPVAQVEVQRGQVDQYIIGWDKSNIAPRFGMAYQFMNKTVLRAGYGIFYGGEEAQGGDPNRGQNIPFNQEVQLQPPDAFAPNPFIGRLSDGIPANIFTQNAPIRFRTVARNFRNPLVHKWNLSLQRELGWGTVLDVSYIGSAGRRLLVLWNPNQPLNVADPAAPTRPRRRLGAIADTNFSTADTFGFSNYHALATQLTKRYSNGLDFQIAYTWGNALTNVGTPLAGGPGVRDVTNLSAEYAAANFDIRHRFVYSGTYELPFGKGKALFSDAPKFAQAVLGNWQANAVLTLQTGFARSVGTQNARCGCGGTVRPDYVPGVDPNDVSGGRTPDRWFNTAAFQNPAPGTFGNVGHFTLRAPGITNLDFSLFKTFPISERINLQFRAESFNLTNTPQFNPESLNLTQGNSRFGTLNGTNPGTTRNFQFALRLQF